MQGETRGAEDKNKFKILTTACRHMHLLSHRDQKVDIAFISIQYEARDFKLSKKTYNKGKQLVWLCPEVN